MLETRTSAGTITFYAWTWCGPLICICYYFFRVAQ